MHIHDHSALERLAEKRKRLNDLHDAHRERMNARLDRHAAALAGKIHPKQQQIIDGTLELLRESGLNNLSLRDIARRVGIQAPALYWYFKSKDQLIDHIAEAILQKEMADMEVRKDDEPWQDWLTRHMGRLRAAMLAYPDGGRIVAGAHLYPAVTLAKSFEYCLQSLRSAGVDIGTARSITMTATHYTFGRVIEEQSAPDPEQMATARTADILADYPNLRDATEHMAFTPEGADRDFAIGLKYIIAGSMAA